MRRSYADKNDPDLVMLQYMLPRKEKPPGTVAGGTSAVRSAADSPAATVSEPRPGADTSQQPDEEGISSAQGMDTDKELPVEPAGTEAGEGSAPGAPQLAPPAEAPTAPAFTSSTGAAEGVPALLLNSAAPLPANVNHQQQQQQQQQQQGPRPLQFAFPRMPSRDGLRPPAEVQRGDPLVMWPPPPAGFGTSGPLPPTLMPRNFPGPPSGAPGQPPIDHARIALRSFYSFPPPNFPPTGMQGLQHDNLPAWNSAPPAPTQAFSAAGSRPQAPLVQQQVPAEVAAALRSASTDDPKAMSAALRAVHGAGIGGTVMRWAAAQLAMNKLPDGKGMFEVVRDYLLEGKVEDAVGWVEDIKSAS